jgi:AcrR family transcriptional regulator
MATRKTTKGSRKAPVVPKQSRAEATRARIREAANKLFLEQGVDDTTVDQIVAEAGVSKGTFYLYFERKEDLLLEYGTRRLRLLRELMPEALGEASFRAALGSLVDTIVRGKAWDRELTRRAIIEMGTSAQRLPLAEPHRLLSPLVEVAQARGEVRNDMPAEVICQFILRSLLGALRDWGMGNDELERDKALDYALTLIFDAIAAERI